MATDWVQRVRDPQRLAALARTRLLDSAAEEAFDRLTRLSRDLLRAPVALVTLVDHERQFFKSAVGLGEPWATGREMPLSHSFCKHVVAARAPLVVTDAREAEVVRDNPAIGELDVLAYAGVPIAFEGEAIGAFCVVDHVPHAWSDSDLRILRGLADAVEAQIVLGQRSAELAHREHLLEAVLATMPAGVVLRRVDGHVVRTNPALEKLLGRSAEELALTDFWSITHPDDLAGDAESREELLAGKREVVTRIKRFQHADGHYVWVRLSAALWRSDDQHVEGTIAVIDDITAERHAEAEILRQARVYHAITRNIPRGAVLLFDHDLRYVAADGAELFKALGVEASELIGRTVAQVARPEKRDGLVAAYRRVLAGEEVELEAERNGRQLMTRIAPVRERDQVMAGIALIQDVTEERLRERELLRAKELFEVTIAHLSDGVVVLNANHEILYANRAYAEIFGLDAARMLGMSRATFLEHAEKLADDPAALRTLIETSTPTSPDAKAELQLARPRPRYLRRTVVAADLPTGPGRVVIWQDVSAERALLAEREQQALFDALTGIPNRRAAEQEIAKAFARADRSETPVSLAMFDVDHFKRVNDRHGHAAGDDVLRGVAAKLDSRKRLTDVVARWGGEEFLAILPVSLEGAVTFCERVRREIAAWVFPGVGSITISAGVADRRPGESVDVVLRRADERLYRAKAEGRNRVQSSG